jgi:fused signal recognition particle receptor
VAFDFKKIFSGLDKTRKSITLGIENVFKNFTKIDDEFFEEMEEVLIMADLGARTSAEIVGAIKERSRAEKVTDPAAVRTMLTDEIERRLCAGDVGFDFPSPAVVLVIGVNGAGKTTTIGKLAYTLTSSGKRVLLAAADTFRAAAIDQLEIWGKRSGAETIKHQEHSDPAAVVFDAIQAAKARKSDVLICDTAGRLHNKKNLMEELRKIFRIISQNYGEARQEVLLVLDATTGQNALQQARIFGEVAPVTGIVLTKLDGTAKGGIVIAIKNELDIPVRFIGVGEALDDLQPFDPAAFAKALFG